MYIYRDTQMHNKHTYADELFARLGVFVIHGLKALGQLNASTTVKPSTIRAKRIKAHGGVLSGMPILGAGVPGYPKPQTLEMT